MSLHQKSAANRPPAAHEVIISSTLFTRQCPTVTECSKLLLPLQKSAHLSARSSRFMLFCFYSTWSRCLIGQFGGEGHDVLSCIDAGDETINLEFGTGRDIRRLTHPIFSYYRYCSPFITQLRNHTFLISTPPRW